MMVERQQFDRYASATGNHLTGFIRTIYKTKYSGASNNETSGLPIKFSKYHDTSVKDGDKPFSQRL